MCGKTGEWGEVPICKSKQTDSNLAPSYVLLFEISLISLVKCVLANLLFQFLYICIIIDYSHVCVNFHILRKADFCMKLVSNIKASSFSFSIHVNQQIYKSCE